MNSEKMKEAIDLIEDTQLAEIACAEACYFTADAKGCVEHVKNIWQVTM